MGLKKRAAFFVMDAVFASILLIAGLVLISQARFYEPELTQMDFLGEDLLLAFDTITMNDIYTATALDSVYLTGLYNFTRNQTDAGNITDLNKTILEQITVFWASNETVHTKNLTRLAVESLLPTYGVEIWMKDIDPTVPDESLYNTSSSPDFQNLVTSRKFITGLGKYKPILGSSSIASLQEITGAMTHSYAYFGGFVGQGNVTVKMRDIPGDLTEDNVTGMIVRIDAEGEFDLYINDQWCNETFIPTVGNFTVDEWNITHCKNLTTNSTNKFTLNFSDLNKAYIAGGYIKMSYVTADLMPVVEYGKGRYYAPNIAGLVNLYDAFYIPGTIESMGVKLHYFSNHTNLSNPFYMSIGNTTVHFDDNSTTEQTIYLDDAFLKPLLNNYTFGADNISMSNHTIPIRIGYENVSYLRQYFGAVDVGLVTDLTDSMDDKMSGVGSGTPVNNCSDDIALNDPDTKKISVARCLDKKFAEEVLNATGNRISIVAYDNNYMNESFMVNLTTNYSLVEETINNRYFPGSMTATCICCGEDDQIQRLVVRLDNKILIDKNEVWRATNNAFSEFPPAPDLEGDQWFEPDYDDSGWGVGPAILGHNTTPAGETVATDLGEALSGGDERYPNLWEHVGDVAGPPNDFTSGSLNYTLNTFGPGLGNDGWDWDAPADGSGPYGWDDNVTYDLVDNERLAMNFETDSNKNNCDDNDCSGAYGITVNITDEMMVLLNDNGTAILSFDFEWVDAGNFEEEDQIWIKGKWIETDNVTEHWLGEDLDDGDTGEDSSPEIWTKDNPDSDYPGSAIINLTKWINESGLYYLHIGAKLLGDADNEKGRVYFDNIKIRIANHTDHYYFRKYFDIPISPPFSKENYRGVLNILSDDYVNVYINGDLVFEGTHELNGTYWNRRGIYVPGEHFNQTGNVIAVELVNNNGDARFDLKLIGINTSRQAVMLVMTDGFDHGAGLCPIPIGIACYAREVWGIRVFAVGYGNESDESQLKGIANCGEGLYLKSDNASELIEFYDDVITYVMEASRQSQIVIVEGTPPESVLYDDSYIKFNYTPNIPDDDEGILVTFETNQFGNCSPDIYIYDGLTVVDAQLTSFSGEHWTDLMTINNVPFFNLSLFSQNYSVLGDPFFVNIPISYLDVGWNTLNLSIGDYPNHDVNCSLNNSLVFSALINATTAWSGIVPEADGCLWAVDFEDGTNTTFKVPTGYLGTNTCNYTNASHPSSTNISNPDPGYEHIANDAYNLGVFNILYQLDYDKDGRVLLNFVREDFDISVALLRNIPYMHGPAIMEVRIWK